MNKKSIGTLSLNINTNDFNYGAILHSWAFQKYLEKQFDADVEVIDYITPHLENKNRKCPLKDAIKEKRIKSIIKQTIKFFTYKIRYNKFKNFIEKKMKISDKHYTQSLLNEEKLKYDILVCESDVIWAAGFFKGKFDKTFFLALDSMKDKKRIAYAPSMADGDMNDIQKKELKELLKNLDFISCRESYEKFILEKYTEKEVVHVMDPVLLLNADDYNEIIGKKLTNKKYLLLYLPVDNNKKLRKEAKKYAKKNNLKIIEITTKMMKSIGTKTLTSAGVEEFLSAIKYADVIFTNSFHAICFSIIFNKEFYAFSRKSNGKVKDICKTMNLENRFFENDEFKELEKIDYDQVNEQWKKLKEKSEKWIINAIEN